LSGSLPAVLAIDGGNSKTDVVLVAADGTVRGRARGPGVPKLSGQTVALLAPVVRAAAAGAGLAGAGLLGAGGPAVAGHLDAVTAEVHRRGGLGGIALTHDHADHSEGVPGLRERFPTIKRVIGHAEPKPERGKQ